MDCLTDGLRVHEDPVARGRAVRRQDSARRGRHGEAVHVSIDGVERNRQLRHRVERTLLELHGEADRHVQHSSVAIGVVREPNQAYVVVLKLGHLLVEVEENACGHRRK